MKKSLKRTIRRRKLVQKPDLVWRLSQTKELKAELMSRKDQIRATPEGDETHLIFDL